VFPSARQWADILTEEFANQGAMETELGIPTCLFGGPPAPGDVVKMAESQQGFISIFAGPLFQSVTNILPSMGFSIDEMNKNKAIWEQKKAAVSSSQLSETDSTRKDSHNDAISPTTSMSANMDGVDTTEKQNKSLSDPEIFNGRLAAGHLTTTATALPLLQQLGPESSPAVISGAQPAATPKQSKPPPKGLKLFSKTPSSTSSSKRAVSAHQHRMKPSPRDDSPQLNGINPNFASSETDVRYLVNGGMHKANVHEHKTVHLSHHTEANGNGDTLEIPSSRKNKKLTQSFKRLWKRRWHSKSTHDLRECSHDDADASGHTRSLASPTTTITSGEAEKVESRTS
jgi:hypothetical protein